MTLEDKFILVHKMLNSKASVVAQQVKSLLATLPSHTEVLAGVLAAYHSPGKATEDGPRTWVSATHAEDPAGVLSSCLQPASAAAGAAN